jgi:antirestriction protein ArdC
MSSRQDQSMVAPAKRDHRQEVTDSIVKMLGEVVAPWQKPWESAGMPLNPTTDRAYRGGNAVHLMLDAIQESGFRSHSAKFATAFSQRHICSALFR